MDTLQEIRTTLRSALASEALYGLVNTRITLRTGIDLNGSLEHADGDPEIVSRVLAVLTALGYSPDALRIVAQKRGASQ